MGYSSHCSKSKNNFKIYVSLYTIFKKNANISIYSKTLTWRTKLCHVIIFLFEHFNEKLKYIERVII